VRLRECLSGRAAYAVVSDDVGGMRLSG